MPVQTAETRPGRPRSASAHKAILDATIELLAELGYEALGVEAIAARAGVSKATIYRHWRTKRDVVAEALGGITPPDVPDTGSAREDLLEVGRRVADLQARGGDRLLARLLGEAASDPVLLQLFQDTVMGPRERLVATILRRGVERGELSADLDVDLAAAAFLGAIAYLRATGRASDEERTGLLYDLISAGSRPDLQPTAPPGG